MRTSLERWSSLWLGATGLALACTGEIGEPKGLAGGNASGGPSGTTLNCESGVQPGPTYLRRLTHKEYARSVRDVLGVDATALTATFPTEYVLGGFDNSSVQQTISPLHATRYYAAAQEIAKQVLDASTSGAIGCDLQADRPGCTQSFTERLGRRLYRRPLSSGELDRLSALAQKETDPAQRAARVLEALLLSPNFLFRIEGGVADAERPKLLRLSGYEVATRLSYFLLGTTPDDSLLDAAASGKLDSQAGVAEAARSLLGDSRMREAMQGFSSQWFRLNNLEKMVRGSQEFPEFGPELVSAMHAELDRLLDDFMWGRGFSFIDIFTSRRGYINDRLAAVYDVPAPGSSELVPFDFSKVEGRGGLFTTAGFLTVSTRGSETSPIHRGVYLRDVVLCDPPPPPPRMPPPLMLESGESAADAEERHTKVEPCRSCHARIDPIGHGLERYDAIGGLRTTYANGQPVRMQGALPDGKPFAGGVELGQMVHSSAQARECVVIHLFRWAMGRGEVLGAENDGCTLQKLGEGFKATGFSFPELVVALVVSDAFRYRLPHGS